MKRLRKFSAIAMTVSSLLVSSNAMAASGEDATYKNLTLEERLYLFDGYGSKWGFDIGNNGLWMVPERPIGDTYEAPFKIRNGAAENTLVVGINDDMNVTNGYVGIGTDTPMATLDVNGSIRGSFMGNDGVNNHNLLVLSSNNAGAHSDAGFSLENVEDGFQWTFRTYRPRQGFAASKVGTGGTEFEVDNTGTDVAMTVVKMGGVIVFEDGHLVTASSRSIKEKIAPLSTKRAMEAFHKLEPVSYVYKSHKEEPVVGFIAEDVPELVAMPKRNAIDATEIVAVLTKVVQEQEQSLADTKAELKEAQEKIKHLEAMQERLTRVETILGNVAAAEQVKEGDTVSLMAK